MAVADVQLAHGYTRLANRLITALALAPWDGAAQRRMVDALLRVTYGLRRRDAAIGLAQWRVLTGLSDRQIASARQALHRNGVLELVEDFDARTQRPQTWRLRKDFTRWGKYRVSIEAVTDAEELVGDMLSDAPTPMQKSGGGEEVGGRDPMHNSGGDLVQKSGGGQVHNSGGGTPSKSLQEQGSEVPKERERKERQKTDTSQQAHGRPHELLALREHLGDQAGAVDRMAESARHPEGWAGSVLALYGQKPSDELAYRGVAPSDRPPILAKTLLRYAGESQPYNGAFFRSILLKVVDENRRSERQENRNDGATGDAGKGDNRDEALRRLG